MALSTRDLNKLTNYLATGNMVADVRSTLKLGRLGAVTDKYENYEILDSLLASILIQTDAAGVAQAAALLAQQHGNQKAVQIDVLPPAPIDVAKRKRELEAGSAHHLDIDGVWVSLDNDQMKHQPASVPIGTRVEPWARAADGGAVGVWVSGWDDDAVGVHAR